MAWGFYFFRIGKVLDFLPKFELLNINFIQNMRKKLLKLSMLIVCIICAQSMLAQTTTINFTANQPSALVAYAGGGPIICPGDSVMIGGSPSATGGTAPFTYLWTPGASLTNPGISDPIAGPVVTTTYNLEIVDARSCTDTSSVVVTVDTCVSITSVPTVGKVSIFPNPNSGIFKVRAEMERNPEECKIQVFSLNGQQVYQKVFAQPGTLIDHSIDISNQSSGFYQVEVNVDGTRFSYKVIIQ